MATDTPTATLVCVGPCSRFTLIESSVANALMAAIAVESSALLSITLANRSTHSCRLLRLIGHALRAAIATIRASARVW
jgi:hypothetical protein